MRPSPLTCSVLLSWGILLASSRPAHSYPGQPFIILVAGGSASGKTFIAQKIIEALGPEQATLLSLDHFYAPQKQSPEYYINGQINFDHPSAVDLAKAAAYLKYLKAGFPTSIPEYTYGQKREREVMIELAPKPYIIVEGIFALYPEILELGDFKVFVDVDRETRFRRRLSRDQKERGKSEESVRAMFESIVEPMHSRYIQPSVLYADLVVPSPEQPEKLGQIIQRIKDAAAQKREASVSVLSENYERAVQSLVQTPGDRDSAPQNRRALGIDELYPTQPDVGYFQASRKSATLLETSLSLMEPSNAYLQGSALRDYLKDNPIPVAWRDGRYYVLDHHHLITALIRKGVKRFYTEMVEPPEGFDPARLGLRNEAGEPLSFGELGNNPYRSLASLLRSRGVIRKEAVLYMEFEWADYLKERLETEHQLRVSDELLLDPEERQRVLELSIGLAGAPEAKHLPGFLGLTRCEVSFLQAKTAGGAL